jgi:hypothetical protein
MSMEEEYRTRAAEAQARAQCETRPTLRAELEKVATAYLRLAEQAQRNSRMEVAYEPSPPRPKEQRS